MSLSKMDQAINGFFSGAATTAGILRTNIVEYDDRYDLTCELPGVSKENIKVEIDNDKLCISAEVPAPNFEGKHVMPLCERVHGTLWRNYRLPNVDATKITATYKDGILYLTMPKMTQPKIEKVQIM